MTTLGYEFLIADNGSDPDSAVEPVLARLAPRFTPDRGTTTRAVRIWLDTFDARLRSAGLALAQVTGPDRTSELILTGPDERLVQPVTGLRPPTLLEALPPGPVRDRIAPIIGIRALLSITTVRSTSSPWTLSDAETKAALRLTLDQATVKGTVLPSRISIKPLQGYQREADHAAKLLAAIDGITADPRSELDLLLEIVAPPAGRPDAPIPRDRDQAAPVALAHLLGDLLTAVEQNVTGTIADIDTEFLHDLRVAVRRTRSALKLAGDVLPADLAEHYSAEFGWLGDLTTPLRDLDVFLLDFDILTQDVTEADPADLEPLREYLTRQRVIERRKLVKGLRSARFTGLAASWRAALTELISPPPGRADQDSRAEGRPGKGKSKSSGRRQARPDGPSVGELAGNRVSRAWRRVIARAAATDPAAPSEQLHDLRKRCKELRYLLELFGPFYLTSPQPLIKELKVLQDCLGAFQDAEVHRDAVRGYAARMLSDGVATAPTLLAMGELTAQLGQRQRRAREESAARFKRFATNQNQRRVAALAARGSG